MRRKSFDALRYLIEDLLVTGGLRLVRVALEDMRDVVRAAQRFGLDFDDAYQYAAAEKHGLTIVSFDSDFDRTERGRRTPGQILSERQTSGR